MFVFITISIFFVSQKNILNTAPDYFYKDFQNESETLVLGKIISDKYNKEIPKNKDANLVFASIIDHKYGRQYLAQSYLLLKNEKNEDYFIHLENINDENWNKGIARGFSGIVVKKDLYLDNYLGRVICLSGTDCRTVMAAEHLGNYTNIYVTGDIINWNLIDPSAEIKLSGEPFNSKLITLIPYASQYGIQGIIFSKIYNNFSPSINTLNYINSLLFSLTMSALVFIYRKIISTQFAIIFFISIIFSPWLVSYARNLYWVPFTWFLPAVFSGYYFFAKTDKHKIFSLVLIYLSFLLKCLSGYEFISSVILFAAAIFVYELFNPERALTKSQSIKGFFIVCLTGVAGFLTALFIHAGIRGDNVFEGLQSIYEWDVKRRTYGDPNAFRGIGTRESLAASPLEVIKTYIFDWKTKFLKGIAGSTFYILFIFSVVTIFYRYYANHQNKAKDMGLFLAFLMPPLSWIILAKSHAHAHFHIGFVLWYFGFAACILYISFNGVKIAVAYVVSWANLVNLGKI